MVAGQTAPLSALLHGDEQALVRADAPTSTFSGPKSRRLVAAPMLVNRNEERVERPEDRV